MPSGDQGNQGDEILTDSRPQEEGAASHDGSGTIARWAEAIIDQGRQHTSYAASGVGNAPEVVLCTLEASNGQAGDLWEAVRREEGAEHAICRGRAALGKDLNSLTLPANP